MLLLINMDKTPQTIPPQIPIHNVAAQYGDAPIRRWMSKNRYGWVSRSCQELESGKQGEGEKATLC